MKLYGVTSHAIDRAVERLGKERSQAHNWMNQIMQTAVYTGTDGSGRIFDHYTSRTRLILDINKDKVVTVYSMDSQKPKTPAYNSIIEKARGVIRKEIAKAKRQFTAQSRKLTLSEAELGVEIAQLTLNKAKCKQPKTQATIQTRIDELQRCRQEIAEQLRTVSAVFEQMRKDAEGYL